MRLIRGYLAWLRRVYVWWWTPGAWVTLPVLGMRWIYLAIILPWTVLVPLLLPLVLVAYLLGW